MPHLRIEHRVVPAGPSIADSIANAALFYGLVHALAGAPAGPDLSFAQSRANFYAAARDGLRAEVVWHGKQVPLRQLLLTELLPLARQGLAILAIADADIAYYLGIIEARIASGQTGSRWQQAFVSRHGRDMQTLTLAYLERQRSGLPVHEWALS
jgi:hypothetical protein